MKLQISLLVKSVVAAALAQSLSLTANAAPPPRSAN